MKKTLNRIAISALVIIFITGITYACISYGHWYNTRKLIQAISEEDIHMVESLLAKGTDPNATDLPVSPLWDLLETSPTCPITVACRTGNLEIVKLLITYGATAEFVEGTGFSPITETLFYYHPNDVEIVNILLDNGAVMVDEQGESLAFLAAQMVPRVYDKSRKNGTVFMDGYDEISAKGITEIVRKLLGEQSINSTTKSGKTLLMLSIEKKNTYLTNYLLAAGVDVSLVDANGNTAYDYAIASKSEDIIFLLGQQ